MAYINEFPHTRNYDQDLGQLICMYKKLTGDYDTLVQIYELVKKDINDITIEQLQKWLDDGTLETLINQDLFNSKIGYYDTVADMVADSELSENNICKTLGYYTVNDGGGGLYQIYSRGSESNLGDNVYLNNGLTAKLIKESNVTRLSQYGIKTGSENDNAPLINYAISQFNNTGGIIEIPIGIYYVKQQINLTNYVKVIGEASTQMDSNVLSTLYFDPPSPTDMFTHSEDIEQYGYIFGIELKNFEIVGGTNANILLNLNHFARSKIENVTTKNANIALYINYGMTNYIEKCTILYAKKYGVLVDNYDLTTTVYINKCYIGNSANNENSQAIYICRNSTNGLWFNECVIESMQKAITISPENNVFFNNCYFENCPSIANENIFNLGLLADESSITNSGVDNTQAPSTYYEDGLISVSNCHIQTLQYSNSCYLFNLGYLYNLSLNNTNINGLTGLLQNNPQNIMISVNNCSFRSMQSALTISNNTFLNNVRDIDRNSIFNNNDYFKKFFNSTTSLNSANWYRVFEINTTSLNSNGDNILLGINTNYTNNTPQNDLIAISFSRYGTPNLAKLSGTTTTVIDQVRLTIYENTIGIEIHYNVATANQVNCTLETNMANYSNVIVSSYQISTWSILGSALSL